MGKNWGIAIGINQYRNLKRLEFAVRDAEAMRDYFRNEVGFDQVDYFSDNSPPIPQDYGSPADSAPLFTTLKRFLRVRFEQPFLNSGDNLWFFFAGHGLRYEDRDYLMPIDGDPGNPGETAILLSHVTERLRRSGAGNVILFLDACRSEGRRSGLGVGEERQQGVITFFSCSPREASYEIESLQGGVFTHTLLCALRLQGEHNCATVERLNHFLRQYVPQVSDRYGNPRQTPYAMVEPAAKYHLILLPRQATVQDVETLRTAAYRAEIAKDYALAEQFWFRVLAASPADPDAIAAIRRIPDSQTSPHSPDPHRSTATGSRASVRGATMLSEISRRQVLQFLGWGGSGIGGVWLLSQVQSWFAPTQIPGSTKPTDSPVPFRMPDADSPADPTASIDSETSLKLSPLSFTTVTVNAKGEKLKQTSGKSGIFKQDLGNGIGLELVGIPAGKFLMGSPLNELERTDDESLHTVTVPSLLMGKYPVTQAQWQRVATLPKVERDLNPAPANFKGVNRPVEQVSWQDAVEFCARLSAKTGRIYRLPSEAEWEYACRAGTTTPFYFGATLTTDLANYDGNYTYANAPKGKYRQQTSDVGSFPPNAFGLYDMHGNVWEWCQDVWHDNYQGAPSDGSAWVEGGDSDRRLLRGGSWGSYPRNCRSAYRDWYVPALQSYYVGFRVVCASAWTLD